MTDDKVSHRELEALLKPLQDGQGRIEGKLDDLANLSTRVSVLEAGKTNWSLMVAVVAIMSSWIIPFVRGK